MLCCNLNTPFSSSGVRSSGAVSSDSDKVSNEDVSPFNQSCSSSTTASRSPVVSYTASPVILAAEWMMVLEQVIELEEYLVQEYL